MATDRDTLIDLDWRSVRRWGFYGFCVLVAVNAVLAISAFVGDYSRETEILATSAVLSVALLGLLANATTIERGRAWPIGLLGSVSVALWAAMFIYAIWDDFRTGEGFEDVLWGALFVGVGATYVSMLSMIRLTPGQRPVRVVADLVAALAVVLSIAAIADRSGDLAVPIAICVIIAVSFAVVLPVLGRLNRAEYATAAVARFCPMCGASEPSTDRHGGHRCRSCGTGFSIDLVD